MEHFIEDNENLREVALLQKLFLQYSRANCIFIDIINICRPINGKNIQKNTESIPLPMHRAKNPEVKVHLL